MNPKTIAATMVDLQTAIDNCTRTSNGEWLVKHRASLKALCKLLPSGSGIDKGTTLVRVHTKPERIYLTCSFHHMNDQGVYDGWTEHEIYAYPSFNGLTLTITGSNRNDIKDHLHEVYSHALMERVRFDLALDRWVGEFQGQGEALQR